MSEWISVEEFHKEPYEGWCWIWHNRKIFHSWHNPNKEFMLNPWGATTYATEYIKAVHPIIQPPPPEEE